MVETIEIYIRLLDEGTGCSRPTQAVDLGNGLFKILPTPNFDSADDECRVSKPLENAPRARERGHANAGATDVRGDWCLGLVRSA